MQRYKDKEKRRACMKAWEEQNKKRRNSRERGLIRWQRELSDPLRLEKKRRQMRKRVYGEYAEVFETYTQLRKEQSNGTIFSHA
jgi:hypothetical protein